MPTRPTALLIAALTLAACKSKSSGACGSGETANADPPLCYQIPKGFKQRGEPIKRGAAWFQITFADEGKAEVDFLVRDLEGFDTRWKALQGNAKGAKATDAKEADFASGKGKILTYTTPEKDPKFIIYTMLHGAKKAVECQAEYRTSAPRPDLVDVCKAAREP